MSDATVEQVFTYITSCAEFIIDDDLNEDGRLTDVEFDELDGLVERAIAWVEPHRKS